jgi:hypothetical protein
MFELLLSALSAGGLVGASNQYMCLLVLSIAAKLGWVGLVPQVNFVQSWWFIAVVAIFWTLTVLPAYGTALGPGVMNVVNAIVNVLSGFLVPVSGALLALAAAGVIADMDPALYNLLRSLRIFDPGGQGIGTVGWAMAGGAGLTAATLAGAKFVAKPVVSSATGTLGTVSAPVYVTVENLASLALMIVAYALSRVNPWLVVGLLDLRALAILALLAWATYQLWRIGKGIGRVVRVIETRPRTGLAVVAEFLVWGSGSLICEQWVRGVFRLCVWAAWIAVIAAGIPALGTLVAAALVPVPVLEFIPIALVVGAETLAVAAGLVVGVRSAASLMATMGDSEGTPIGRSGEAAVSA